MRMDLAGGRERLCAIETEAAEIDFMNIKQQGVDSGTRLLYRDNTGAHRVALHMWRQLLIHYTFGHNCRNNFKCCSNYTIDQFELKTEMSTN